MFCHGTMDGGDAIELQRSMEGGNITITDHPFGMGPDPGKIQVIEQVNNTVPATGAEDHLHLRIVKSFLQIVETLIHRATVTSVLTYCMITNHRLQSPPFKHCCRPLHYRSVNLSRGGKNDRFITGLHVRGALHCIKIT